MLACMLMEQAVERKMVRAKRVGFSLLLLEGSAVVDWALAQDLLALACFTAPRRLPSGVNAVLLSLNEFFTARV